MSTENLDIITHFYTNLDILSKLKPGDKIYINTDNIITIDEPYMFQGLWRYCNNISRKDALYVINKLLNDIEMYINALFLKNVNNKAIHKITFNDSDINKITTISEKLKNSIAGITHLKETYSIDTDTITELDRIIQKITNLIINFQNMIQ